MRYQPPLELGIAAALGALLLTALPSPAQAFGGLFRDQKPIVNAAEQVVFALDGDRVSATIRVSYSGEAEEFAWVIPVPAAPDVRVGSELLFKQLAKWTEPGWQVAWDFSDVSCGKYAGGASSPDDPPAPGENDEDPTALDQGDKVRIDERRTVGPYDTVVLGSEDAEALIAWLNDNGFQQPPEAEALITHYVSKHMVFVALKLTQDAGVGDIQPVVLDFPTAHIDVPLILTQVAAIEDMPVKVWVLSEHRTIPTNWLHVVLNHKKIDWLNGGSNYDTIVTEAVNEAAGHGFVTEFAGPTDFVAGLLYSDDRYDLDALAALSDPEAFVTELVSQQVPFDGVMQNLLRDHIPLPEAAVAAGVTEREFYNCLECHAEYLEGFELDVTAFVADLREKVVEPLRQAQEMLDGHAYVTRMLTTVSPDEMSRDPRFAQNADLPVVRREHQATAAAICSTSGAVETVRLTLPDGATIEVDGPAGEQGNPTPDPDPEEKNAKRIELYGPSGPPTLLDPETVADIDALLDDEDPEDVLDGLLTGAIPGASSGSNLSGPSGETGPTGCAGGAPGAPASALLLALGLLALVARRRR